MNFFNILSIWFQSLLTKTGAAKKKKDSAVDNFYETVYRNAFPGGESQIGDEVGALKLLMSSVHSEETIRSLLLYVTSKLYFRTLDSNTLDSDDFIESIVINKKISHKDASYVCNLAIMKFMDTHK